MRKACGAVETGMNHAVLPENSRTSNKTNFEVDKLNLLHLFYEHPLFNHHQSVGTKQSDVDPISQTAGLISKYILLQI